MPEFDLMLVWPLVGQVAQAGGCAANEAAAFSPKHLQHPFQDWRVEQDVVVQEVDVWRFRLIKQELAMLSHA
jgi:hypothetical protein